MIVNVAAIHYFFVKFVKGILLRDPNKNLAALLKKAQMGNKACLQELCRQLERYIRGFFSQRFQDESVVDDLCQETYLRLLRNILTIKNKIKLKNFVAKVAFHVMQDHFRQKYRKKEEQLETSYDGQRQSEIVLTTESRDGVLPQHHLDDHILVEIDLEQALNQLSEKSRKVLIMKSQGYNYEEISAEVGLSVSGVKMQVKRSIEQLRFSLFSVTYLCLAATTLMKQLQL